MATSRKRVFVCGVGMTKFEKPGRREDFDYPDMIRESVTDALNDAGVKYENIEQAVCGYCYGDSTCGQRGLYEMGITGIPMYNVNNNCATGSSALHMAKQLVSGGLANCVLAVGFEKMERGSLQSKWTDRAQPIEKHVMAMNDLFGMTASPMAAQLFGNAGVEHMQKYGTKPEHFAKIAEKNHRHSVQNPRSQFRDEYTLEDILNSRPVFGPLTKLQCCPTSDGGAAAIVCSEEFLNQHNLKEKAVEILSMEMATDVSNFDDNPTMCKVVGQGMTEKAASSAFKLANINPSDVDVVELHDCFSANELITYEGLGLCKLGEAGKMVDNGDNTYGGKYVVNPSGGLISKGHPLGATGLAQCFELCKQLRNECDVRQVEGATVALQHNLGLGGAAVVGLYRKLVPLANKVEAVVLKESSFQSDGMFVEMEKKFAAEKDALLKKIKAVFRFELSGGPDGATGVWCIDAKTTGSILRGEDNAVKADCTFKMSDADCFKLLSGKLNPQAAFLQGKLKISGNMGLAMKLQQLKLGVASKL